MRSPMAMELGFAEFDQEADRHNAGHQFVKQLQLLFPKNCHRLCDTRKIGVRLPEASDQAIGYRIDADRKDDRNGRGLRFGGKRGGQT